MSKKARFACYHEDMNMQFHEEQVGVTRARIPQKKDGFIAHLLLTSGLAKNKSQANIMMLITAIICIVLTVFVITSNQDEGPPPLPDNIDPYTGLEYGIEPPE